MTIICFSHDAGLYGATRSFIDTVQGFQNAGIKCIIYFPAQGPGRDRLTTLGIASSVVPYKHWILGQSTNTGIWYNIRVWKFKIQKHLINLIAVRQLYQKHKNEPIDLVYTNTSTIPVGIWLAQKLKVKHLWHIREFGQLDHGHSYDLGDKYFKGWLLRSSKVIFISKALMKHYTSRYNVQNKDVIHNGVYSESEIERQNISLHTKGSDCLVFIMVGQIKKEKGHFEALKAFKRVQTSHPSCELWIVGSGSARDMQTLHEMIDGHSSVSVFPFSKDINKYYQEANVLLMCSESEAFGRVTVEAMSHGVVVIGKNSGATPEIIKDGVNGLLYDGEEELYDKMIHFIDNQSSMNEIVENAWQMVYSKFTKERYLEKMISTVHDTINTP